MAETVEFAIESPLISHMLKRLKDTVFDGIPLSASSMFIYGPVCIDRQQRAKGILQGLFKIMKHTHKDHYDIGIVTVFYNLHHFHLRSKALKKRWKSGSSGGY